jgi:hypothetical protein
MGASWATVVSYSVAAIAFPLLLREVRPVIWLGLKIAFRPFLLALAIEASLHYLAIAIPFKLLLAALAFVGGSLAMGAVGRRDVLRLLEMARLRRSMKEPGAA